MEQYLALSRENQAPGVVKPEIRGNVNFEIKSQFMRELREDTFSGNKNEDAHDHIDRVLKIVSLFNILGVSKDVVLLRVFLFTLTRSVKRWVDRLTLGYLGTQYEEDERKCSSDPSASVNVMPRNIFEYLRLSNLRNTNMLVEMADMTKKSPLGNNRIIFDMEKKDHNFMIPMAKILMMNSIGNNGPSCPPGNPSLKSLKTDNLQDRQEQQVKKKLRLDENIPVKHFCKPIMQTYDGKVRMWPTYDPDKSICDGGVKIYRRSRVGNLRICYTEWYRENSHDNKPRLGDYTFREWMMVKVGHKNVNKSVKKALFKSWVIDCFEEALNLDKDPMERSFDDYKWVFDLEIEQLADEYELGIGKKGHILEMIGKIVRKSKVRPKNGGAIIS
ncbi:hypothetical protein Tco_1492300 [Tanacetum coccineum]